MEDPYVPKPNNNLVLAILTTIFCCLPFGIVAILKASKVNSYYMAKQYDAANQAAEDAKKYSIIGIVLGIIVIILNVILNLAQLS